MFFMITTSTFDLQQVLLMAYANVVSIRTGEFVPYRRDTLNLLERGWHHDPKACA